MNAVSVRMPPILRPVIGGRTSLEAQGDTINDILLFLSQAHPALGLHLFDEQGQARRNIVCLHDGELVRAREFARHSVRPGDEIVLTNALVGG